MAARILIAEDDPKQAELIRRYLQRDGHSTVVVHSGREAIEQARAREPDLVLLDVMMPGVDGLDVCRVLRAASQVPIIMLTARSTEDDLLLGLDLGADDYLTKPYSPRELVARVRTVLRRSGARGEPKQDVLRLGDLEVDTLRYRVTLGGSLVDVTPSEFKVLRSLLAEPGRVFSRQQLLESAFGFDHYVLDRTIDVHVKNLRKKLELDPARPRWLVTVYGVGYKASGPAVVGPAAVGPAAVGPAAVGPAAAGPVAAGPANQERIDNDAS